LKATDRVADARRLVSGVYDGFEGLDTRDMRAAKSLLDELA
jgi:hypothetical protein